MVASLIPRKPADETHSYQVQYVHKIAPRDSDRGPIVRLSKKQLASRPLLARALREQRALYSEGRIRSYHVESNGQIVVFPYVPGMTTYWHAILLWPGPIDPTRFKRSWDK